MIPRFGLSKLSSLLIDISGPDSAKFLNGLVTSRLLPKIVKKNQYTVSDVEFRHINLSKIINLEENWGLLHEDIFDPDNEILVRRDGLNSMFLNSKGRVITDSFLYASPFLAASTETTPSYLVEVNNAVVNKLFTILNMHKLISNVNISKTDYHSYYYYNDTLEFDEFLENLQAKYLNTLTPRDAINNAHKFISDEVVVNKNFRDNLIGFAVDNRIPNFGLKFVIKTPITEDFFSEHFKTSFQVKDVEEAVIDKRRYLNGLFEVNDTSPSVSILPFDMNLDYINGLSLDKGCYVGQELTIRSFNSGVIRKRIVPVQLFEVKEENLENIRDDDELVFDEDDPVINCLKNISSANISKIEVTPLFQDEAPAQETSASPFAKSPFGGAPKPRKTSVGKLLSIEGNLGFMLINLKEIPKKFFKIEIPGLNSSTYIGIKVAQPNWWPEDEA